MVANNENKDNGNKDTELVPVEVKPAVRPQGLSDSHTSALNTTNISIKWLLESPKNVATTNLKLVTVLSVMYTGPKNPV